MNFLKKITKKEIFQKVAQIANNQIKSKIVDIKQNILSKQSPKNIPSISFQKDNKYEEYQNIENNLYDLAEQFILRLSQNSKTLTKQRIEKITRKQVFSELQIEPIYLQQYQLKQLFLMQLQYASSQRYERTQILHSYLQQVDQTIKKILFTENMQIFETFQIIDNYLDKINKVLTKIKLLRLTINKIKVEKEKRIKDLSNKKSVLQQKIRLLKQMRQKQEFLIKPENIEQVYYTQRRRHKLYNRIKNTKGQNSYFNSLRSQIVSISKSNIKIIEQILGRWINQGQSLSEKNIQKVLICLYFVKNEQIYRQNGLLVDLFKYKKQSFIKEIQRVKRWKTYQYIRDPGMKNKIVQFLDILIKESHSNK